MILNWVEIVIDWMKVLGEVDNENLQFRYLLWFYFFFDNCYEFRNGVEICKNRWLVFVRLW